jgi:hypothetical protein
MDEPSPESLVSARLQGSTHSRNEVISVSPDLARREKKQRFLGGVSSIVTDGSHCAATSTLELYHHQNKFRMLHELVLLSMVMPDVTMYRHSRHFTECIVFEGRPM